MPRVRQRKPRDLVECVPAETATESSSTSTMDPFLDFALKEGPPMLRALCQSTAFTPENARVHKNKGNFLKVKWLFDQPKMRPFDLFKKQILAKVANEEDIEAVNNDQGEAIGVRLRPTRENSDSQVTMESLELLRETMKFLTGTLPDANNSMMLEYENTGEHKLVFTILAVFRALPLDSFPEASLKSFTRFLTQMRQFNVIDSTYVHLTDHLKLVPTEEELSREFARILRKYPAEGTTWTNFLCLLSPGAKVRVACLRGLKQFVEWNGDKFAMNGKNVLLIDQAFVREENCQGQAGATISANVNTAPPKVSPPLINSSDEEMPDADSQHQEEATASNVMSSSSEATATTNNDAAPVAELVARNETSGPLRAKNESELLQQPASSSADNTPGTYSYSYAYLERTTSSAIDIIPALNENCKFIAWNGTGQHKLFLKVSVVFLLLSKRKGWNMTRAAFDDFLIKSPAFLVAEGEYVNSADRLDKMPSEEQLLEEVLCILQRSGGAAHLCFLFTRLPLRARLRVRNTNSLHLFLKDSNHVAMVGWEVRLRYPLPIPYRSERN